MVPVSQIEILAWTRFLPRHTSATLPSVVTRMPGGESCHVARLPKDGEGSRRTGFKHRGHGGRLCTVILDCGFAPEDVGEYQLQVTLALEELPSMHTRVSVEPLLQKS
jgi:hypothetical protein